MRVILVAAAVAVALSGCATKRYGRMTDLSDMESKEYTCHEIRLEQAKVRAFQDQVARGAKIDWRSVAGFLGDYGIGNAMERSEAETSARHRLDQLDKLYDERRCDKEPVAPAVSVMRFMGRLFGR